jgi:hypothetical protein
MQVDVKQERVSKRNTDYSDRVRRTQQRGSSIDAQPKETMERNEQVAAVPPAHAQREDKQHAFHRAQFPPAGKELDSHPERQHSADRVAYDLENFEWGHL